MSEEATQEVLVVVSKLKKYIKEQSGMNTSDSVASVLSSLLRTVCDQAVENARTGGRKTVMDRDVQAVADRLSSSASNPSSGF